jgi:hypothetical protein
VPEEIPEHAPGAARTCIPCPIGACDWHYDEPIDGMDEPAWVEPTADDVEAWSNDWMKAVVFSTVRAQVMQTETALREHFTGHPLEEWAAEVVRLRRQIADRPRLEQSGTWTRPSEERIDNGVQEMIDLVRAARDIDGALDAPDSAWEPTRRQRDRFRTTVKHVLRSDAKYRFEHPEEPA